MFFALWPTHAQQAFLAETARDVVFAAGGRPVPPENFHVTLAFLGSVPEARIAQVEAIAREVASEVAGTPVEVTFDAIEYWKKPKLICATGRTAASGGTASRAASGASAGRARGEVLGGSISGEALGARAGGEGLGTSASAEALAGALKSHLTPAGLMPDLKPFRAHVTLARKIAHGTHDRSMESVLWTCAGFALVESRTGPGGSLYSVLSSWPLCTEVLKMPEKKHE